MKKLLTLSLAVLGFTAAQAVNISWVQATLPVTDACVGDKKVSQDSGFGQTAESVLNKVKTWEKGNYVGANGGAIAADSWQTPSIDVGGTTHYEGDWINNNNIGAVVLAGRGGTQGTSAALVLGLDGVSALDQIKLNFTIDGLPSGSEFKYGIGVVDGETFLSEVASVTATDDAQNIEMTFTLDETYEVTEDGKVIIAFNGPGFKPATDTYTITGIKVEYGTEQVPEPTVLALLALGVAGVALRRKKVVA